MAKKGGEVVVDVSANTSKLDAALDAAEQKFDDLGNTGKGALEGLDGLTGGLASNIYKGVQSVGAMTKGMGLLKVALISTGIGAIAVAVGSLAAYFTQTAEGAAMLQVATEQLGAIFQTIIQRVADLGGAIVKLFQGDFKGAAADAKAAVTGIGEEIKQVSAAQAELTRATQELAKAQNAVTVATAKNRAEIERLKGVSDDTTKSINERIKAAEQASTLEAKLLAQRLGNANTELRIARQSLHGRQASVEEARNLADLEAEVYNLQAESSTLQTELRNKLNGLRAEQRAAAAERKAQEAEAKAEREQAALDAQEERNKELQDLKALNVELQKRARLIGEAAQKQLQTQNQVNKQLIQGNYDYLNTQRESENNYLHDYANIQKDKAKAAVSFATGTLEAINALNEAFTKGDEKRAERNFKINKAISMASAIMNTAEGVTAALTDKTQPSTILRLLQTAAVAATGIAQIATISRQKWPPAETTPTLAGGGGGGMGGGSAPQAPQIDLSFMRGSQTSGFKSYVLASDVSNAQQANQKIKEQASLVG